MPLTSPATGITRATSYGSPTTTVGSRNSPQRAGATPLTNQVMTPAFASTPSYNPAANNSQQIANQGNQSLMSGGVPPPQGYNQLQQLFQTLLPQVLPGLFQSNATINNQIGTMGGILAGYNNQANLLQQQGQNQQAGLGINQEQLANQRGILDRQAGLMPQQNALQEQLYGLNNRAIEANRGQLNSLFGLSQEDLARREADLSRQEDETKVQNLYAQQGLRGQMAAQGAMVTPGANQGFNQLSRGLESQLANFKSAFGDVASQRERGRIGYEGSLGDINRAQEQQGINRQQYGLNYQEQLNQIGDQRKNLDLISKQHGLQRDEIENRIQQGLGQLGLSRDITVGQVAQAIIDAQAGKMTALAPILGPLYQLVGLNAYAGV